MAIFKKTKSVEKPVGDDDYTPAEDVSEVEAKPEAPDPVDEAEPEAEPERFRTGGATAEEIAAWRAERGL